MLRINFSFHFYKTKTNKQGKDGDGQGLLYSRKKIKPLSIEMHPIHNPRGMSQHRWNGNFTFTHIIPPAGARIV